MNNIYEETKLLKRKELIKTQIHYTTTNINVISYEMEIARIDARLNEIIGQKNDVR